MKILGIILIFLSGTSFGLYHSFKPIFRKNDLIEMKRALLILNSEIKFLSAGIKEALKSIGGTSFGMYYSFRPIYRKNDLLEMKRAILILNSEIRFLSTSIKEALISIENSIGLPIK